MRPAKMLFMGTNKKRKAEFLHSIMCAAKENSPLSSNSTFPINIYIYSVAYNQTFRRSYTASRTAKSPGRPGTIRSTLAPSASTSSIKTSIH